MIIITIITLIIKTLVWGLNQVLKLFESSSQTVAAERPIKVSRSEPFKHFLIGF